MDGVGAGNTGRQSTISNYVFGGISSDDAVKGTDAGDQPEQSFIEQYNWLSDNTYFLGKWWHSYDGVGRCNEVLQIVANVKDMTEAEKTQVIAEARFLRGHFHFEAKKMWNKVPYIDEKIYVSSDPNSTKIPNDKDIWANIEADFDFAAKNLPTTQTQKGRASQWAAKSYLSKAYIFQKKWALAKTLLDDVVKNSGKKLMANYHDNYRTVTNNNSESIFEVQFSINDGTTGNNGNAGDNLNWPYSATAPGRGCCGFYQPSHNLVNAFKTENGLPMIGNSADGTLDTYNKVDLPNDQGITSATPFTLDKSVPVDPRLDWTVGRRGVNFLDWGPMPGSSWIRDQAYAGPFTGKKWMYYLAEENSSTHATSRRSVNNNYRLIKLSHVILWLAECEIELGNLQVAEDLVNQIRDRAKKKGSIQDATVKYEINTYPNGTFATKGADFARNAIRMEQRLEFAMEGHRFFDLVRWGIAEKVLNKYAAEESVQGTEPSGRKFNKRSYMAGKVFASKNNYYPLPQDEILNSQKDGKPTLVQNPGY